MEVITVHQFSPYKTHTQRGGKKRRKKNLSRDLGGVMDIWELIWSKFTLLFHLHPTATFVWTHAHTRTCSRFGSLLGPKSRPTSWETQSHISSGSSWGLRIPGTDIWSLCFSSWAWRSDVSRSSRNRSLVSSPANSYTHTNGKRNKHDFLEIRKEHLAQVLTGLTINLIRPVRRNIAWCLSLWTVSGR